MKEYGIVKGLGVSPGYAVGRIIFQGKKDYISKEPVILVVRDLNRSIVASLSENVCAVLAEKGNVGCHGAGILREKGIPCILRIENIFEVIKENEIAEVIGDTGIVRLFEQLLKKQIAWKEHIRIEDKEVCYRPNRVYQRLRYEILKDGWERCPEYLFGLPRCKLRIEKGVIFITNAPNLEDLRNLFIENPDEFLLMAKKRDLEVRKIKNELAYIRSNIDYTNISLIYEQFIKCIDLYQDLLKYIYITQFISDDLTEELINLIERYGAETKFKEKFIRENLKSDYVANSVRTKIDPGVSTTWKFPCKEPYVWQGKIEWKRDIGDLQLMSKMFLATEEEGFTFFTRYSSLVLLVPLLYQLAEEHYFISSSICSFLNKFIEILADKLVLDGELESKEEILEQNLKFVIQKFNDKIKEEKK